MPRERKNDPTPGWQLYVESILRKFLKRHPLPSEWLSSRCDDWGDPAVLESVIAATGKELVRNESVRYRDAVLFSIFVFSAGMGRPRLGATIQHMALDEARFTRLFAAAPEYAAMLADFLLRKRDNPSLLDRVTLALRQIPFKIFYDRQLTAADRAELRQLATPPFLAPLDSPSVIESLGKISTRALQDGELAQNLTELLGIDISAATVREARRRMEKEDNERREQMQANFVAVQEKHWKWEPVPEQGPADTEK